MADNAAATVRRGVRSLIAMGLLKRDRVGGRDGFRLSGLDADNPEWLTQVGADQHRGKGAKVGADQHRGEGQISTGTPVQISTPEDTSEETNEETKEETDPPFWVPPDFEDDGHLFDNPPTTMAASSSPPVKAGDSKDIQEGLDAYNAVASKHGLSLASRLTDERRKQIKARILDAGGIEGFRAAMALIPKSGFLLGTTSDWKCTIDSMIRPANFLKLSEGGYSDSGGKKTAPGYGHSDDGSYMPGFRN